MAIAVTACSKVDPAEDGGVPTANFVSLFEPAPVAGGPTVPFPIDLLFAGFNNPTLNIPSPASVPFVTAANLTDGFSTTASVFTDLLGFADFATVPQAVLVIDTSTGMPLVPDQDITFTDYPAEAPIPNTNPPVLAPVNAVRTRIQIKPLRPLKPATRYIVVVTDQLRDLDGQPAVASTQFRIARRAMSVDQQDDPSIAVLHPLQRATLEAVSSQIIRPVVAGVLAVVPSLSEENIVLAWPFTTQSIAATLTRVDAAAPARTSPGADAPLAIVGGPSGFDTGIIGAPPIADIFVGAADLPCYLQTPANANDPVILATFFAADPAQPDLRTDGDGNPIVRFLGQVPCGAFAAGVMLPDGQTAQPRVSTTACFPVPVERGVERVPMLVTVPNAASGRAQPGSGWPVAIFQHGITRNRSDALALAPALAAAGFVVVSIDLPLHGITDAGSPFRAANPMFGARERTFDIDLVDNETQAPGPDGNPDPSGTHFVNLGSLLTSRDNFRQGVADLAHLSRLVTRLVLSGDGMPDVNPERIHFVGHSLGGMVGSTMLGVNDTVGAASVVASGGGIAKLLDGSRSFGPVIAAGLGAQGVVEGTDTYETFMRFAQHVIDDADPINYAASVAPARALHFIEVIDDLVVPNAVPRSPGSATLDRVVTAGRLSGSTPLIRGMGLDILGPITPPLAEVDVHVDPAGIRAAVRFSTGDHGSVLNPAADPAATQEMQRQIANFLGSQGTCLPLGGSC